MNRKVIPILFVFFCMSFGDAAGTLVGFATTQFNLSTTMAGLLPMAGLIAFGILSVPTAILQSRKGKKFVLLLGLSIIFIGLIIPIISISKYAYLLLSILLIGSGGAIMQVAGNPIMRDVSDSGKFSRNLTFGQFIKAIGSLCGPLIPVLLGKYFAPQWMSLFYIFSVIMVLTITGVFFLKISSISDEESAEKASFSSSFALLKDSYIFIMILGLFLYVGAEVSINSWIATYLTTQFGFDISSMATLGIGFFFFALMVGRGAGSAILNWISAKKFFLITSILSTVSILGLFTNNQTIAIISIFLIGLGFANVFPLVFSILIDSRPEKSNELSGLLVMAIVGGAIMPFIMGVLADYTSVMISFIVPFLSFLFILWTSIISLKKS